MTDKTPPTDKKTAPAQPASLTSSLTYRDAGVDIDAGGELVERIKPIVKRTFRPEVIGGLGGFGALFELPVQRFRQPVLVSGTDGVGTKLKLATELGIHDSIGIDLVAMCVNDIIVQGAEPLFFLDYYASGKLDVDVAEAVIKGIAEGCHQAGAALIGGETAEMPGMYASGDYDLAGFCVGVVEKDAIIDGSKVVVGDSLVGIASSGAHSNGYSLIRRILARAQADLHKIDIDGLPLGLALLKPTRIYVKSILALLQAVDVHAIAHITGGGLTENVPRVLPDACQAYIRRNAWKQPSLFNWLQHQGNVAEDEMLRTFNCGIGMVLCVAVDDLARSLDLLAAAGETCYVLGEIHPRAADAPAIVIN